MMTGGENSHIHRANVSSKKLFIRDVYVDHIKIVGRMLEFIERRLLDVF